MEIKYLVKKESFFTRFVNFIKGIFGKKEEPKLLMQAQWIEKKDEKANFLDEIRINKEENKETLDLQSKYENKEIDLCAMSNEEIHQLNALYKTQVLDLKKKLEDKKAQVAMMKNRIKNYSVNI